MAVIPAAGWGTRFLPASKVVPKELLPIIDRPVIQYAVEEAVASGIKEIVLVTSQYKRAIEDYFDRTFELEAILERRKDQARLDQIQALFGMASIYAVRQGEQKGLGHAILMAKGIVGDEPFAVMLPDDIMRSEKRPVMGQLLDVHRRRKGSVMALLPVPQKDVTRYGIVKATQIQPKLHKVLNVVEKPKEADAPSNLASMGRYVLSPRIFQILERQKPGAIGEIQLAEAIGALAKEEAVYGLEYEGTLLDAGTPLGLLKASLQVALERADTRDEMRAFLKGLLKDSR